MARSRSPLDQIEFMRNVLAFLLVGAFVGGAGAMFFFAIPEQNKELVSYMAGQLSGMALMALGFYFVDKVGQAALDAKKTDNTGKLADLAKEALKTGGAGDEDALRSGDTVQIDKDDK